MQLEASWQYIPVCSEQSLANAALDACSQRPEFAIAWIGTPDVAGGTVSRAQGQNAYLLRTLFFERYDNTDVYRHMYLTLFGKVLPSPLGERAPDRP